ncbi:hypothetical protein [Flammeovirga sp. SJP92]|uniref:hypothetical protein n=1 Tax=Flammeovirga sp. SJP92 TaxID=1775430 RepID=UPI0012F7CC8C|nr:hypothetical protein [Flammeovirga sp. SJP92]
MNTLILLLFPLSVFSQVDEILIQVPILEGSSIEIFSITKDSVKKTAYIGPLEDEYNITDHCKPNFEEIVRTVNLIKKDSINVYFPGDLSPGKDICIIYLYEKGIKIRQVKKKYVNDKRKSKKTKYKNDNDLKLFNQISSSFCKD